MPKPTNKEQLLKTTETERIALEEFLAGLTPDQMTLPGAVGDWSVKDVLGHILEWEQMVLRWYQAGLRGKVPATPSEEYNWAQLPQLNQAIYLKYRERELAEVQKDFKASYKKMLKAIHEIPEQELFTHGQYSWTKNNLLAAYFVSSTSSHYHWARTTMRKNFNARKPK